jgi:hypothetical protein
MKMNRLSRLRRLVVVVTVMIALPCSLPPSVQGSDKALWSISAPEPGSPSDFAAPDTQGLKVLAQIAAEKAAFRPNLSGAERPTPQQYARCALDRLQKRSINRILFSVKLSKYAINGSWDCMVQFVEGHDSYAEVNLNGLAIRNVHVAYMDGSAERIRAAFIKETVCTRLALEEMVRKNYWQLLAAQTKLSRDDIMDLLATYGDGMAVFCLPQRERKALRIPDYMPYKPGPAVCTAIERLSHDGRIRPGGLGQLLAICTQVQ